MLAFTRKFLLFIFLFSNQAFSQNKSAFYLVDSLTVSSIDKSEKAILDSFLTIYHQTKEDSVKLRILNSYVEQSQDDNVWPLYNQFIYELCQQKLTSKSNHTSREIFLYKRFAANSLSNKGFSNLSRGEVDASLNYFLQGLKIYEEIKDIEGQSTAYNNIGYIYKNKGDVSKALEYYHKSLKINEQLDHQDALSNTLNNIGVIYKNQGDIDKALEYYTKSLKIREALNDKQGLAATLNNIGYVYNEKGDYEKALYYYEKCLKLDQETGEKSGEATSLNNIGLIYEYKNEYEKAVEYFEKSREINEQIGNKKGLSESLNFAGSIYVRLGKTNEAEKAGLSSLALAKELGYPSNISNAAELLAKVYRTKGNWKSAFEMYNLSITMRDSIKNVETEKASLKQQLKYDFEKQEALKEVEHKAQIALAEADQKRQRVVSISAALGLLLVLFFAIIVLKRYRITQKQKAVIESQKHQVDLAYDQLSEKNKEIVDSIRYAKRIQTALLKAEEHVTSHLPEHFVLFKPKDIVSGDFYWSYERENWWYISVADCTGHGVPGAFLTMLGTAYLNEIVSGVKLLSPNEILNQLRDKIVKELGPMNKDETPSIISISDGMDISLMRFNLLTKEAEWAGANNPLWVFPSVEHETETAHAVKVVQLNTETINNTLTQVSQVPILKEIRADKQPIGQYPFPTPFTNHKVQFNKGDVIYLFSDGFADQFGGPMGKKLKYKPLQQKLSEILVQPLSEQKIVLNQLFDDWRGNLEQVDDVCMIGIRV